MGERKIKGIGVSTSETNGERKKLAARSKTDLAEEVLELRHRVAELEFREAGRQRPGLTLSQDEPQFRAITDNMVDGLITIDERGLVGSMNPAAEEIFGYTAHEVIGHNVAMLMHESDRSRHDGYLQKYMETGNSGILGKGPREIVGRHKTGKDLPLELAISRVDTREGVIFVGSLRDVSDRKRKTEALKESESRFRHFAESTSDWFWEVDAQNHYTFVSNAIAEGVGTIADWYIGKSTNEVIDKFFEYADWQPYFEAFEARLPYRDMILRRTSEEGNSQWIRSSGQPFFDAEGNFAGFRGTASDITDQMLAVSALSDSERRYKDITDNLPVLIAYHTH